MDLNQRKLSKSEWESIEVPVSSGEQQILRLIMAGYHNVNIRMNSHNSMFSYLKIDYNEDMEDYLYNKYFSEKIREMEKKYKIESLGIQVSSSPTVKKADIIRIQQNTESSLKKNGIYEYVLVETIEKLFGSHKTNDGSNDEWHVPYFTLYKLLQNNIPHINRHITRICKTVLSQMESIFQVDSIIFNAVECIEKNTELLKYADMTLYEHQKEIFTICKNREPKLVLYIAPTGTGKTMTPIALSENHKIIFVCAARHVGVSLARAAISMNKKIAFAFGCESATDIRLHYFSAKEYSVDRRSGGIRKVDNSIGDKVEIMICDIKSYLPAMYYMKSFHRLEELIVYWDEPTITLDYAEHEFHSIIQKNWRENLIPNMVLSSATLPKLHELTETIADFQMKFAGSSVYNIVSHDCKKSIPILNKEGYVVLPHYLGSGDYVEVLRIVEHTEDYLTLLRYFDLKEVVDFIQYVHQNGLAPAKVAMERHFPSIDEINMKNIKMYYLKLLKSLEKEKEKWLGVYRHFQISRCQRVKANEYTDNKGSKIIQKTTSVGPGSIVSKSEGAPISRMVSEQPQVHSQSQSHSHSKEAIFITTKDAFTLTDGPTIFLSKDVEKIAKFYIQQSNIPAKVMEELMNKIEYNNKINEKINIMEKKLEDISEKKSQMGSTSGSSSSSNGKKDLHKLNRDIQSETASAKSESKKIMDELEMLRSMTKSALLNDTFIPNTLSHLKKWAEGYESVFAKAFTSNVEERIVNEIMLLHGIEDTWKVLLMMGIGVFTNHNNIAYTEIMKKLADEQKLYMIIASSDYIYGTNYQFCHGILSKDLNLTQEKIIQAMGRIGRNNIQQDYTLRFRDDSQILKLFCQETDKPEVANMNRLFSGSPELVEEEDEFEYE
jgi:hypothetical protein